MRLDPESLSLVRRALAEDLAGHGDITTACTVSPELHGQGVILAKESLVLCGLSLAEAVQREVDPAVSFLSLVEDGAELVKGQQVAVLDGPAASILTAERTMLNFLMHLSGVATQARRFARAVEGTQAAVVDTRKTVPGLRAWEKRAVVLGGCRNHRFGLFDMILIKNNHLEAAGGVREAVQRARSRHPYFVKVEVEVENEADLREALECGADIIMLDNQDLDSLRHLVKVARSLRPEVVLEASGRVSLENVRAVAETGVDIISTSALTMGAPPVDLSLSLSVCK